MFTPLKKHVESSLKAFKSRLNTYWVKETIKILRGCRFFCFVLVFRIPRGRRIKKYFGPNYALTVLFVNLLNPVFKPLKAL